MNQAVFQSYLTPQFQFHTPNSRPDAAESLANAYHLSNIGQTTTPFGAPLINANKELLKTFIELSLDINFYGGQVQSVLSEVLETIRGAIKSAEQGVKDAVKTAEKKVGGIIDKLVSSLPAPLVFLAPIMKSLVGGIFKDLIEAVGNPLKEVYKCMKKLQGIIDLLDVSKIAYTVMSVGFCLYWITSKMSPVPPMPPCIAPTTGTIVLIPGLPIPLNSDLSKTFSRGNTVPQAIGKLFNSLVTHQLTIIGLYLGLVPTPLGPVPIPIPWFSMLNIPFPNIDFSSFFGGKRESKGAEDQRTKSEQISSDPDGSFKDGNKKMKDAANNLKKQNSDSFKC